ncbi:hypothetical protein P3T76_015046 [Phytophthora citrophthora]|uniref:Methyltransferase domain-containing protein n=1 Tax=Phytophthora citrophthora TaxID=4793 RepID=A0AAD9G066_9STRA|nr:hypothetical protein P3T76_015046 [Phytophthora citrophthora]
MKLGKMATLDDAALYTLAYFTSTWVQPVDVFVLPRLREVLDGVNTLNTKHQLVGLLEVRRMDADEHSSSNSINTKTQRLEPSYAAEYELQWLQFWLIDILSTFRSLCKHFQVTDLPACVLLDAQGQALTHGALKALETLGLTINIMLTGEQKELCQLHEDEEDPSSTNSDSWNILGELLKVSGGPNTLQPLRSVCFTTEGSDFPELLEVDDTALVKMREEAFEQFETGQFLPAASSFVRVLLRCPTCTKSSFNLAVILQMIGETYFAVASMLRVVALDDSDSVAHTVLRSVYYLEEPDLVVGGYHCIISTDPDNHVRAVHSLATLEGATTTRTAAPAYVAEVFDELADSFEEKLVSHLQYRVPWQLVEALQKLSPPGFVPEGSSVEPQWVVADVGCGTGLCGRLLRPHVKHITGVDISPLMIEKTRAQGSYDELQTVDIVPFLESRADESLDLIISADVWIYVGALEKVFELSAHKLRASCGWMVFSIELISSALKESVGFLLAPSGRFQHSHEYITSLARRWGFTVAVQQDIHVRKESGEPIPGRVYLLQLTGR